jgi:two-component SAPR family response regulator
MLRGTTGLELAAQMKKIKPDVPIVLYSGRLPPTLQNIDVFINKDEPTSDFLRIVRDLLRRYYGIKTV